MGSFFFSFKEGLSIICMEIEKYYFLGTVELEFHIISMIGSLKDSNKIADVNDRI
jgi:hypothetical protein